MYWIGSFVFMVFVVPNTTNFKERRAFSDKRRLDQAIAMYKIDMVNDSVTLIPGSYYKRSKFANLFLGDKQRELWTTQVKVRVFDYGMKGGLEPFEFGGGQQTISIKLKDPDKRNWALRSVNKDQQSVLPGFLRLTFLRFLARDQLASANPYGHLVIPVLADAIGIFHTTPELVLIPYDEKFGEYNERMAGRLAYLDQQPDSSWSNHELFGSPKDVLKTEEMLALQSKENIPVDTMLYLKTRLFDMLISDWDRHEGNWQWALAIRDAKKIFLPIAKDRDNAFFQFDEGLVSRITLAITPKFQSFRKDYGKVEGLMFQSKELDKKILSGLEKAEFQRMANRIQNDLTDQIISKAFAQYPRPVYEMKAKEHEEILKARLRQLPDVATEFYDLIHRK